MRACVDIGCGFGGLAVSQAKQCVYCVSSGSGARPWRLWVGAWPGSSPARAYRRIERSEIESCVANWALEGPETWEDRKKRRIERKNPFGHSGSPPATLTLPQSGRRSGGQRRGG